MTFKVTSYLGIAFVLHKAQTSHQSLSLYPYFLTFFFFCLASPTPLLPWIMDSWIHSFFKLNGTKDLGLESRGIIKTHVTGVMSILPALLFAAGWRSVLPCVCDQLLLEVQTKLQVYQLLKAICYLPVQTFNSMQLPKTRIFFPSWLVWEEEILLFIRINQWEKTEPQV